MQLAGSANGTPPCHRPITEHAGIEHGGSCLATVTVELCRAGGGGSYKAGVAMVVVVVQEGGREEGH